MKKEEDKSFELFWAAFPRRVAKQAAIRAYRKALKLTTSDEILRGAMHYADERMGKDTEFTKHPTTWLNGGCWADYASMQASPGMPPKRTGFYAAFCSPEREAWEKYGRTQNGRDYPRDRRGGWYFPTRWPPGHPPADHGAAGRHAGNHEKALGAGD